MRTGDLFRFLSAKWQRVVGVSAIALSLMVPAAAFAGNVTFTTDTTLTVPGSAIDLTVLSGSDADEIELDTNTVTITVTGADSLVIQAPGENRLENDQGVNPCGRVSDVVTITVTSANSPIVITPSATVCAAASSGGGGGGTPVTPAVTVTDPNGGEALTPGSVFPITWNTAGRVDLVNIAYSADDAQTWITIAQNITNTGTFNWTVPDVDTDLAFVRVEATDTVVVFATDRSDLAFSILGTQPPPAGTQDPTADPTATGTYSASLATASTPTIDIDMGLVAVSNPACTPGSLIRGSLPAVYYCGVDGKRYTFPNEKTYFTWFTDFSSVIFLSDAQLAAVPLGGNVTYRPGVRMVKIQTDPKVYAISRGGLLRWVETEAAAVILYGLNWNQFIHDVPDVFFADYTLGAPITEASLQ